MTSANAVHHPHLEAFISKDNLFFCIHIQPNIPTFLGQSKVSYSNHLRQSASGNQIHAANLAIRNYFLNISNLAAIKTLVCEDFSL